MTQTATDEGEGAQAIFCYVADIIGVRRVHNEWPRFLNRTDNSEVFFTEYGDIITKGYQLSRINTTKSESIIISYINKQPSWFRSSLLIAQKIVEEVDDINKKYSKFDNIEKPGWNNFFYQHGDDEVMGILTSLFNSANEDSKTTINPNTNTEYGRTIFGDINKWTPADIYFATATAKNSLKRLNNSAAAKGDYLSFTDLNAHLRSLVQSGDLLPLSLKKVRNNVTIVKVNFSRTAENRILATTKCTGVEPWNKMLPATPTTAYTIMTNKSFKWKNKWEYKPAAGGAGGRDIKIKLVSQGKKGMLHFRATPASGGKVSLGMKLILSYTGSSALGGQVASVAIFLQLLKSAGANDFAKLFGDKWDSTTKQFKTDANAYIKYGLPVSGKDLYAAGKSDNKAKDKFNDDMGAINAIVVMNKIRPVLQTYFGGTAKVITPAGPNNDPPVVTEQDEVVRAIFAYTGSRMPKSARFVIAKD